MPSFKKVIGNRYGKLVVLEDNKTYRNNRSTRILKCKCDCGKITNVNKSKVLQGITKSCGCLQEKMRKELGQKRKKETGEASFNELYYCYIISAKRRNYEFNLTKEEFKNIITKPCIYCGNMLTQEKRTKGNNGVFKYTGIDRYDNNKGYILDNCVSCCGICNRLKSNLSIEEFEKHLEKIIERKKEWKRTK